ncbi:putative endoplasmic reticulum mannosyl-oligosaccharide -alpha-mannosidase protein [Neofusicoccum parvum]|uniref:Endoplasmic reticulum mannosyl-oligosaccharide -alpha-mannosidase protein n=1 Tax=Neofusicoccum parvum TaxID=310453 RepID=A0ACB5SLE0_9PEZI|nr:putative endoplasmic reticulum mannosyl-oligosaccharide -alpha-mannosidase protein [Neofusicoccum parvum]
MNINRDPFGLRPQIAPKNAFSVLQQTASRSAAKYSQKIVESGQQALESGRQALEDAANSDQWATVQQTATDAMAFAVPRNVPQFDGPQRRFEDATWPSSGRSRFPDNGAAVASSSSSAQSAGGPHTMTDRLGGMFGDGKELPMYKDKPYNYGGSARRGWFRRRRSLVFGVLAFFVFLYWFGLFSGSEEKKGGAGSSLFSGIMSSRPSAVVDWDERRERVRDAFKLSWEAYENYAWGYDEFRPVSKKGRQMVPGGMGWIIVDALDTLILMNLTTQLTHAREWVSTSLTYDKDHDVNTFETTIRMLGGLLSAHYLSTEFPHYAPIAIAEGSGGEDLYLEKATDLADRLLGAYESKSGIPYASINLKTGDGIKSHADGGASSTAEATSLQLEMKYVAKLTGETNYWEKAEKIMEVIDGLAPQDGLVPIFINPDHGIFQGSNIRVGSRGDSYYEYLIKQYLQTNKQEPVYLEMWDESVYGMRKHLITYSSAANLTILGERPSGLDGKLSPKIDHLVCFLPGTIALGATMGKTEAEARQSPSWGKKQEDDMELARELMKTCWGMYKVAATGLAPEITYFNVDDPPRMWESWGDKVTSPAELDDSDEANWKSDYVIKSADRHNLQRPETVESLFYMWRITGENKYREWGWEMFQAFVKHTLVEDGSGFTSINDVTQIPPPSRDNMESFWLAETLKYFYLLFGSNDVLPLTDIVFNTEAHPLPTFELGKLFKTGWERKAKAGDKSS